MWKSLAFWNRCCNRCGRVQIVFTSLYFYFCEWRLFPNKNRLKEMENSGFGFGECAESGESKSGRGMNNVSLNSTDSLSFFWVYVLTPWFFKSLKLGQKCPKWWFWMLLQYRLPSLFAVFFSANSLLRIDKIAQKWTFYLRIKYSRSKAMEPIYRK